MDGTLEGGGVSVPGGYVGDSDGVTVGALDGHVEGAGVALPDT